MTRRIDFVIKLRFPKSRSSLNDKDDLKGNNLKDEFYTDSNGMMPLKRVFNKKLPVEASFYPIASWASVETAWGEACTVVMDRSTGVTSPASYTLELLANRINLGTDDYGIYEAVHDRNSTFTELKLVFEPNSNSRN